MTSTTQLAFSNSYIAWKAQQLVMPLLVPLLAASVTAACGVTRHEPPRQYTSAQQRMLAKFGTLRYELKVDAMKGEEFQGVNFYEVGVPHPFYGSGVQSLRNESRMVKSGPIPEQVRIVWRESDGHGREYKDGTTYNGKIIGEEVIEVGSRIPQEVIDDLRRNPAGMLRLKFRMSKQGTMFGWDIQRRPGYDPNKKDERGSPLYVAPEHSMAGGDFREAHIYNGKPIRNGWYIDKKTGRRIETDF